jgi:hypothetical protein
VLQLTALPTVSDTIYASGDCVVTQVELGVPHWKTMMYEQMYTMASLPSGQTLATDALSQVYHPVVRRA